MTGVPLIQLKPASHATQLGYKLTVCLSVLVGVIMLTIRIDERVTKFSNARTLGSKGQGQGHLCLESYSLGGAILK